MTGATMTITLTFDNGPDPETTPRVLDILARRGLRTTFFVLGDKLRDPARRRTAERAHAEGHWIANHTFNHMVPLGRSAGPGRSEAEIARTQELIGDLAHPDKLFRPFGGGGHLDDRLLDESALSYLTREGFTCVLWNAVPRDWEGTGAWVERALDLAGRQDWTLMVLHDLETGAMDHLERFLDQAEDRGARFVQDFPPDCVPIRRGRILRPLDTYVAA